MLVSCYVDGAGVDIFPPGFISNDIYNGVGSKALLIDLIERAYLAVYLLYGEHCVGSGVSGVHPEVDIFSGHPFGILVYVYIGSKLSEYESSGRGRYAFDAFHEEVIGGHCLQSEYLGVLCSLGIQVGIREGG